MVDQAKPLVDKQTLRKPHNFNCGKAQ